MKIPWDEINELTKYLEEKDLTELTIETKNEKVTIKRDGHGKVTSSFVSPEGVTQRVEKTLGKEQSKSHLYEVTSPMVGTFYAALTPGGDPFVQIGSKVKVGDVLCVIEAMKIMNELPVERGGTVVEILVKDGQTVEYGQVLIRIGPN